MDNNLCWSTDAVTRANCRKELHPTKGELKAREQSKELRVLMTSPAQFRTYLQQQKRSK